MASGSISGTTHQIRLCPLRGTIDKLDSGLRRITSDLPACGLGRMASSSINDVVVVYTFVANYGNLNNHSVRKVSTTMSKQESIEEEVTPALSEKEMDELDSFLMSDATTNEVMMLDCLDGFLTAIASGPAMPKPEEWIPRVWGSTAEDAPTFESAAQAERITDLMMRHMNAIVWSLQQDAEHFEPVFDMQVFEGDEREYMDGEMWAHGFMTGIDMQRSGWKPCLNPSTAPWRCDQSTCWVHRR